ncbi:hypothetical protein DL98DRAFT_3389 [Cadophora sp. DSE1049]|nr:hypothetical protein DL98DRAFT_3389 [Cadophora sp. DSE1049]
MHSMHFALVATYSCRRALRRNHVPSSRAIKGTPRCRVIARLPGAYTATNVGIPFNRAMDHLHRMMSRFEYCIFEGTSLPVFGIIGLQVRCQWLGCSTGLTAPFFLPSFAFNCFDSDDFPCNCSSRQNSRIFASLAFFSKDLQPDLSKLGRKISPHIFDSVFIVIAIPRLSPASRGCNRQVDRCIPICVLH